MNKEKYIITITEGTWNGLTLVKFTQMEVNRLVESLKNVFGVNYTIEKIK